MELRKLKIKKGDTVEVITGADRGKKGVVLDIKRSPLSIKVQGVRLQKKHDKQEGLQTHEGFIDYSNVKLVSAGSKKSPAKKKAKKKSK